MKKLLCLVLSLTLVATSSVFMVYASNNDQKAKPEQNKITETTQIDESTGETGEIADVIENEQEDSDDSTSNKDKVSKQKDAKDETQNSEIAALKAQFMEFHRDKEKRKEILKQIVELRRQNNDSSTPVFVDGSILETDVPPVIKSGRTLIPLRAVSNSLKAKVEWDPKTSTVTISKDNTTIVVILGNNIATVNGQEIKIEVPAELISNRTMVPIRFISEIFKKTVEWDKDTGSVIIDDGAATPAPSATLDPAQTPTPEASATSEVVQTPTPAAESTATPVPSVTPVPAV